MTKLIEQMKKATLLIGSGLFLFLAWMPGAIPAQSLAFDDVFTSPGLSKRPQSLEELSPQRVPELFETLEEDLVYQRYQEVLRLTDLLLAYLSRDDAQYGEALWYRARAYDGRDETQKVISIARDYLSRFPQGPRAGWFLLYLAEQKETSEDWQDAAVLWREILQRNFSLSPTEALRGARVFVSSFNPVSARKVIDRGFGGHVTVGEELVAERDRLLLESLLIRDDSSFLIPRAKPIRRKEDAMRELRRGLLLLIRNDQDRARETLDRVDAKRHLLGPASEKVLDETREAAARSPWPITKENAS